MDDNKQTVIERAREVVRFVDRGRAAIGSEGEMVKIDPAMGDAVDLLGSILDVRLNEAGLSADQVAELEGDLRCALAASVSREMAELLGAILAYLPERPSAR